MNPTTPRELLDTLLGYLDFAFEIQESESDGVLTLQVYTEEAQRLIGRDGRTLDDLQFLLNRLLQVRDHQAPRVVVDVEHYRTMRQDGFLQKIRALAEQVRASGRPITLDPMNSYERRLVHTALKDDPLIQTSSPVNDARFKRITLARRANPPPA